MKRPTLDKQPIRILQSQYEYYTLKTLGREALKRVSRGLNELFRIFPDKHRPEDFFRNDMQDYILIRQSEGVSVGVINFEVNTIKTFWYWMMDYKDQPIQNIATVKLLGYVRRQKNRLTLSEFSRLMSEIHDPRVLEVVRAKLLSQDCEPKLCKASIANKMREASVRAGVPYVSLRLLPEAVHQAALALLAPDIPVAA